MNKYFIVLSITLFTSSLTTAMNPEITINITTVQAVTQPKQRIATPRVDRKPQIQQRSRSTPAHEAYDFALLINSEKYNTAFNTLLCPKPLKAYGPALVLKSIIDGKIAPESPLACKKAWESYTLPGIEKDKFLQCSLYIADAMEEAYEHNEKKAMNYFLIKKHLQQLLSTQADDPSILVVFNINNNNYEQALNILIQDIKNPSSNKITIMLREILNHSITKNSPFYNSRSWRNYAPCEIDKRKLLLAALYITKRRLSYTKKRNQINRAEYYANLYNFFTEIRKIEQL